MSETEEEFYVYAEWDGNDNVDTFRTIHVLGIEKENPVIQVGDNFFVGRYEHALGTYMFFENDPTIKSVDPLFDKLPEENLKYVCKTRKLMKMERTYLTPKAENETKLFNIMQKPEEEVDVLNFNSIQEALENFRKEWTDSSTPDIKMENVEQHFPDSENNDFNEP